MIHSTYTATKKAVSILKHSMMSNRLLVRIRKHKI
jgi:hypothetical protein